MKPSDISPELRSRCINTIKMLSVDAIEAAKSGHPGAPMGAADIAFVLWTGFLRFDPKDPAWKDRDRFILSIGHASMLQYSLMHLTGYDLKLDEIRQFRQWGSRAAGHPEYGFLDGVEVTTGPLGQGFAHGVGMALASRMLAARVNTADGGPVGSRVFVLCGDGDMMEGVTYEAASLAGHLGLGNLVCLYDSNRITIEGSTDLAFGEDVAGRFVAQGWDVRTVDGHDHQQIHDAIDAAVGVADKPSLIICNTFIGRGAATMEGSHETHGAPLGAAEVKATKLALGWPLEPTFHVPADVAEFFSGVGRAGTELHRQWDRDFARFVDSNPDRQAAWNGCFDPASPDASVIDRILDSAMSAAGKATRVVFGASLQQAFKSVPNLVGGSADLGPSNNTVIKGGGDVRRGDFTGANLHFGIREHAMGAITNGIALHGAFRPFCATFLIFSDYLKPAARLAALMRVPSTFVFSHDSFRVGEDGPTHQPVEQLAMLRAIPGFTVLRPADPVEMAGCWSMILERDRGPIAIATTRQNVPAFPRPEAVGPECVRLGGYVLRDCDGTPDVVMLASGSEVQICFAAIPSIEAAGLKVRLVSVPSITLFMQQPAEYRESILGRSAMLVGVEAGATSCWMPLIQGRGFAVGLDHFGSSAPAGILEQKFGFTPECVATLVVQNRSGRM